MQNSKLKLMSTLAGTMGMLGIALGVAAQSVLGAVGVLIGIPSVLIAAHTLADGMAMEGGA